MSEHQNTETCPHTARATIEQLKAKLAHEEAFSAMLLVARSKAEDERDEARAEVTRGDVAKALLAQIDDALNAAEVPTLHPDIGAAERKPMLLRERVEWLENECDKARTEVDKLKAELKNAEGEWKHWKRIAEHRKEKISAMVARPEPSRLEIAAMLLAASLNKTVNNVWVIEDEVICALDDADKLIAAAKEEVGK
jgi:multidrug resistance efflux pump